jgi:hypothetical protein
MSFKRRVFLPVFLLGLYSLPACGGTVDVIFYDNRFGQIDDQTGAYTQIGTLPIGAAAGIGYYRGIMYVEDLNNDLFSVNASNGAATLIGATGLGTTPTVFTASLAGLFEVDYASNLYQLNAGTGKATLIGATGLAANNGWYDTSLSSDGTSLYYTQGSPGVNDELYRINQQTGVATDLGSTGVTAIAGSAFVNGSLELYQYGQNQNYIYSAPDGSTAFTRESVLNAQILDGGTDATGTSVSSGQMATPEPASAALMGFGLVLIAIAWRKKIAKTPVTEPERLS